MIKLRDIEFLIEPFDEVAIFFENEHPEDNWYGYWKDCPYMNCEIVLIYAYNFKLNFLVK